MARRLPMSLAVMEIITIILLVLYATHLSSCHPEIETLCVNAVDDPTECSTLTQRFNCSVCQPLSFYVQCASKYLTSNVEMMFTKGSHCLPPPPHGAPVVNLTRVSNFTMKGLGDISYNSSEEGAVQPSSVITCSCDQNKSGILFYKSNAIRIETLTIEDCGTKVVFINPYIVHTKTFTTMSALLFFDSYDIELIRLRMNRNLEYGMFAEQVSGNFTISNSAFLRCLVFPVSKTTYIGSNVRILYNYGKYNHRRTSLLIEHSWFLYGGHKSKWARGLSIVINRPEVSVHIDYIKAMYIIGGNVAINVGDYTSSVTINNSIIAHGSAPQGGGIAIRVQAWKKYRNHSVHYANATVVAIFNTSFVNNSASSRGGGASIDQHEDNIVDTVQQHVSFVECQFIGNSITYSDNNVGDGAAVHVFKRDIPVIKLHTIPMFSQIVLLLITSLILKLKKVG